MSQEQKKNENRRYVGKVRNMSGQNGNFQKVLIDNPNPANADGSANQYYKGSLIWLDAVTGKKFLVKGLSVRGVHKDALSKGFISSLTIDLDSEYEVQELE